MCMCVFPFYFQGRLYDICCVEKNGKWCEMNVPNLFFRLACTCGFCITISLEKALHGKDLCVHRRMRYQPAIHVTRYVCHIHLEACFYLQLSAPREASGFRIYCIFDSVVF
jgi:hypothetical protein